MRLVYCALPILHGDRVVGTLDATADHGNGTLRVHAIDEDIPFTNVLASWLDLDLPCLIRSVNRSSGPRRAMRGPVR